MSPLCAQNYAFNYLECIIRASHKYKVRYPCDFKNLLNIGKINNSWITNEIFT